MKAKQDITVEAPCPDWHEALADCDDLCRDAALATLTATLTAVALNVSLEIGIRLTDDNEQRDLNKRYRNMDAPTNVLSFPMTDTVPGGALPDLPDGLPLALGDVVLAFETIQREAQSQGKSLGDHLAHLVVHGVLHLLGHDHMNESQATAMENLETAILAGLGVANPYEDNIEQRASL